MRICVIPARKGSKRLPGKNVRLLGGAPMIVRTFDVALKASCFGAIVCSTDSEQVKALARERYIGVHDRLPEDATDHATTEQAVLKALKRFPDDVLVVVLQPTSPLRTVGDVLRTVEVAENNPVGAFTSSDGERPSGAVYAMRLGRMRRGSRLAHQRCAKVAVPKARALDVDTAEDFARAKALLGRLGRE